MKRESAEVLNLDVEKLIEMLNGALCEEWLAYYQYWVGAHVMEGPMRTEIAKEFLEHAQEEHVHSEMLIQRIIQLGGMPVLSPDQWMKMARCKYDVPTNPLVTALLAQNLDGERCAIHRYQQIANFTAGIDFTTCDMATHILREELEHENDILDFQKDLATLQKIMAGLK